MFRAPLTIAVAVTALGGCVEYQEGPRYPYGNPPGWIDRNRDGVDDRLQDGRRERYNPPGWIDRDRDGVDDRVERHPRGGYYDRNGLWHWY